MELKVGDSLRFKSYNSFFNKKFKEMGFRAGYFYEIQAITVLEPGYLINGWWFVPDEDDTYYIWDHFYTKIT